MASPAQVELFRQLTEKRAFPPKADTNKLLVEFSDLSTKNASDWIDKALALPMRDDSNDPVIPPPF